MPICEFSWKKILAKKWVPYVFLAFFAFAIYAQTLHFGFSYFDDNVLVLDNFGFISDFSNFFKAFEQDTFHTLHAGAFYYRPFLTLSFMFDALIGGKNPGIFHFSNILLHIFSVCLVFVFLQKLNYNRKTSFWVSLIFAAHPVLTQAVAWIPGRNDSLLAVFVLASFIFLINYFKDYKWENLGWHSIFFLGALFSKETAFFAPILFVLYLFFPPKAPRLPNSAGKDLPQEEKRKDPEAAALRPYGIKIFQNDKEKWLGKILTIFIGWLVVLIFYFLLRGLALNGEGIGISLGQSIKFLFWNLPATVVYMGKIIFPFNLSVLPILRDSTFIYGTAAALIVAAALFLSRKNIRLNNLFFGLVWFLVFLIPSFLRPNQQAVPDFLEHRIYLSLIGFIIVLLEIQWEKAGEWLGRFLKTRPESVNTALLIILVISFSAITAVHGRNFRDRAVFWESAVKTSPHHPLAHRNLGAMHWLGGRYDKAEKEYKKSLELNPDEEMAHNNLGLIYAQRGDYNAAIAEYFEELKINPYYDNAFYNLGLSYWALGEKEEAAKKWEETIEINPDYLDAYRGLIIFYKEKGDKELLQKYLEIYLAKGGKIL